MEVNFDDAAVEELRSVQRPPSPGDGWVRLARRVWNGMSTDGRRSSLVARGWPTYRPRLASAREHGLVLAVRGGGHNVAGNAVCDDGIVIDRCR